MKTLWTALAEVQPVKPTWGTALEQAAFLVYGQVSGELRALPEGAQLDDLVLQIKQKDPERALGIDTAHTAATLLLSAGTHPKKVQDLLGHSTISLTLDTYSHILPSMQDEVASAMEGLLGKKARPA